MPRYDVPFHLPAQIEARAFDPEVADRVLLRQGERTWSYRHFRDESLRHAHFLRGRLGSSPETGRVAMLLENHCELLALYAGCAYANFTLFGLNTGLRGEALDGVLEQSGARLLVVDERFAERVLDRVPKFSSIPPENVLVLPTAGGEGLSSLQRLDRCLDAEVGPSGASLTVPDSGVTPESNLMVIYTSGTTGLPKGINNNHFKLLAIGMTAAGRMDLEPDDCGYACMPLFHSNSLFLGFQPALHACASLAIRERFSASGFVPDVLRHGVTWWNYVGEPVHYVLKALEREYDGDLERLRGELSNHPGNRLRYAVGNGASPPDIDRFSDWFGLDDMFELYGSTEAAISTFRRRSDPRGSVGAITDEAVRILGEDGRECAAAEVDADGRVLNYAEAVGEICRVAPDTGLFQGYFANDGANAGKYREGVYHSGDLGHVLLRDGERYLYFDGRTDDWIRKDGENFSAAPIARLLQEHPDVDLAATYGVPCPVSDEWVMCALKLRAGARFDPRAFFAFCQAQADAGSMDPKWIPDFVRVVDEFTYTSTQKILVRELKREHFDRRRLPEAALYWRLRGEARYRPFDRAAFDSLRARFEAAERLSQLDA